MTGGIESANRIISSSRLNERNIAWIRREISSTPVVAIDAMRRFLRFNPAYHFTTDEFGVSYADTRGRSAVLRAASNKGWTIDAEFDGGFRVSTNYLENIIQNGFRPMTCVAAMPEGESLDLVVSHPKLYLASVREMILKFGKHAIPYKPDEFLDCKRLDFFDIKAGLVIINDDNKRVKKGKDQRESITNNSLLRSSTHYLTEGADSSSLVGSILFDIPSAALFSGGRLSFNSYDVLKSACSALWESLPEILKNIDNDSGDENKEILGKVTQASGMMARMQVPHR